MASGADTSTLRLEKSFPLVAAHTRLRQAHDLWHKTAEAYPFPEDFVLNLNQLIVTLRQVTFMLQKQKARIEDFDEWYEAGWRQKMKADPQMVWLHDARNTIEKVGDLDIASTAMVTIIAGWLDGPYSEFEVPPHVGPAEIAADLEGFDLPERVRKEGLLKVERRWVASDLPGHELTDVCAHGYGVLATMLSEAHERLGVKMQTFGGETHEGRHDRVAHLGGRLPCMLMTREARTAHVHLPSGNLIELGQEEVEWGERDAAIFEARSAEMLIDFETAFSGFDASDPFEIGARLSSVARRVLAHEGHHDSFALFFSADGQPLGITKLGFEDQAGKYLSFRSLADQAERSGADTVIFIGEVWTAQLRDGETPATMVRASERPDREEALVVQVATAEGRQRTYETLFSRDGDGRPVLGQTLVVDKELNASFLPLRQMWRRRRKT